MFQHIILLDHSDRGISIAYLFFVFYFGCRNVPIRKENKMFVSESEITK